MKKKNLKIDNGESVYDFFKKNRKNVREIIGKFVVKENLLE